LFFTKLSQFYEFNFFFLSISTFKIGFVGNETFNFFNLFFIKLSWSRNPSYKFNKLARDNLSYFFLLIFFRFYSLILDWLEISKVNLEPRVKEFSRLNLFYILPALFLIKNYFTFIFSSISTLNHKYMLFNLM